MIEKYQCEKCKDIAEILVPSANVLSNVICLCIVNEQPCKGRRIKIVEET